MRSRGPGLRRQLRRALRHVRVAAQTRADQLPLLTAMGSDRIPECVVEADVTEAGQAAKQVAEGLMQVADALAPIYDLAEGQRAQLIKRGWSMTAAESAASVMLNQMLIMALQPTGQKRA